MQPGDKALEIGVIWGPHGVRGELELRLHNPHSSALQRGEGLSLVTPQGAVVREGFTWRGGRAGRILLSLAGVDSRERAEAWRGSRLCVDREGLEMGAGEYLYADLVGCSVRQHGQVVGTVAYLFSAGASDLLVVERDGAECLVPFVADWVRSVDLARREIELDEAGEWEMVPSPRRRSG